VSDRRDELCELISATRRGALALFNELSDADVERPMSGGDWRIKDTMAHLAGVEPRLRGIWVHAVSPGGWPPNSPTIDEYNAATVAARRDWTRQQLVDEFEANGRQTLEVIRGLQPDDLAVAFDHPVRGVVTIESQIEMVARHMQLHVDEIRAALAARRAEGEKG
jgi:hypothetical protein